MKKRKSKLEKQLDRRRKIAYNLHDIATCEGEDADLELLIADINDALEKEGLPPFTTYGEMTEAILVWARSKADAQRKIMEMIESGKMVRKGGR
jgi:hypothetical protein